MRPTTAVGAVLLGSLGVYSVFLALAVFAFPAADDFCFAAKVHLLGYTNAQLEWYLGWSGRFTATALISAFALLGDIHAFYPLAPASVLALTWLSFFALTKAVAGSGQSSVLVIAAASALSVIFLAGLPDVAQTVYWVAGSFTYQFGNVCLLALCALVAGRELSGDSGAIRAALRFFGSAVAALAGVGSNEVTMISMLFLLGCGTAASVTLRRDNARFWGGLLVVALSGALVSLLAPGNAARADALSADGMLRPAPWLAVFLVVPWVLLRIAYWLSNVALWASGLLVLLATWGSARAILRPRGAFDRRWLLVPACWAGLLLVVNALGFLVNRYPLPERAEGAVYMVFLLGWYPCVVVLGHALLGDRFLEPPRPFVWCVTALLVFGLIGSPNAFEAYKDIYRGFRYRQEMMARLDLIRSARASGRMDVEVPSLSRPPRTLFATEITTDTRNFRNMCLSDYYGLRSIRLGAGG